MYWLMWIRECDALSRTGCAIGPQFQSLCVPWGPSGHLKGLEGFMLNLRQAVCVRHTELTFPFGDAIHDAVDCD